MIHIFWYILLACTTIVNGLLAGASLDQSIEQLPARHKIGIRAYSSYSKASHRSNGRFWLIPLGSGSFFLSLIVAICALVLHLPFGKLFPVLLTGLLGIMHTLSTLKAVPINLSQWEKEIDDKMLAEIFTRYERWQAIRAMLQFLTFVVSIWALVANSMN